MINKRVAQYIRHDRKKFITKTHATTGVFEEIETRFSLPYDFNSRTYLMTQSTEPLPVLSRLHQEGYRVVAAHTALGKTTLCNRPSTDIRYMDGDSIILAGGIFPDNYLCWLGRRLLEHPDAIHLVSTHPLVLKGLEERGIKFALFYPHPTMPGLDETKSRLTERMSNPALIASVEKSWWSQMSLFLDYRAKGVVPSYEVAPHEFLSDFA